MQHVTPAQMQAIDRYAIDTLGIPGVALMENAGRAVAHLVLSRMDEGGRVAVCCGAGNNGGDGFVVARHLANHGVPVEVILVPEGKVLRGDAKVQQDIARAMRIPVMVLESAAAVPPLAERLTPCAVIVDALLGTGLRGEVRETMRAVIAAINEAPAPVIAVDIPSGLSGETGRVLGTAVRAETTVTLQLPKTGFQAPGARAYTGEVRVVDIGIPVQCCPVPTP